MTTYFSTTFANGPISVELSTATTIEEALAQFAALELNPVDDASSDVEDWIGLDLCDADPSQFDDALIAAGGKMVWRIDAEAEANTSAGWYLWAFDAKGE